MLASSPILGRPLNEPEAFRNLIEALRVAEESARQLAFMREQKDWLLVEHQLATVRKVATRLATRALR